jgi:hypothetical protein
MPIVLVTAIAAAFYGLLRNRVPAEVSIVLLAGIAIDALAERTQLARLTWQRRKGRSCGCRIRVRRVQ